MIGNAIVQIIRVNEKRSGVKDGRPWELQDAECILLDEHGQPQQVGVLSIPKDLRDKVQVGIFTGAFALKANLRDRRIEAVLTGLTPFEKKDPAKAAAARA